MHDLLLLACIKIHTVTMLLGRRAGGWISLYECIVYESIVYECIVHESIVYESIVYESIVYEYLIV
jgi:hypothetical protein